MAWLFKAKLTFFYFTIWAQFHGSAYRKHRIGAYGSREFCAYGKRISRVSGEFWLLRVRTPLYHAFYAYKASAEIRRLHVKGGIPIVSAEFGGKQSHEIGPCRADEGLGLSYIVTNSK